MKIPNDGSGGMCLHLDREVDTMGNVLRARIAWTRGICFIPRFNWGVVCRDVLNWKVSCLTAIVVGYELFRIMLHTVE